MKTLKQISRSKRNKKNINAHEQVEKALRQSEKRYKQLLNSITDYIYSVEIKDGRPTKTVHGKGSEKGSVRNLQIDYINAKGKITPIEINANVLQTSSGEKIHTLCRDVTQRKHAIDALVKKEKLYRTLFDLSPSGIMLEDSRGNILDVNEALCRSFGYTKGELIGKNVRILVPSDRNTEIENHIAEILSGKTLEHVVINLKKDGSTCNMELHEILITLPNGKKGILVIANDITERKRTENALRDSEEKLRQVIDLVPHFIFAKNRKGQFILVNRAVAEAYGTTVEQLLGKTDADFNPDAVEVQHFLLDDLEVMDRGIMKDIPEENITDSTGQVHYLHTIKIPFRPISTSEDAILGVSTNITERKKIETQLQASYQKMRQLTARVQEIREEESTRIAREIHDELGQILTGIKMDLAFLEDALLEQSNTSQRDKLINKIESTSKLVDGAIQTVRKVTTELRPAILDSMGILAAIEWQAEEFQRRTGIACEYNSPLENIELDRDRSTTIFRILQESLTNIVRHAKATKVRITFRKEDNALFFDVIDNGSGMLYQDVKKLNSFGILGMKERATLIGGHVEIHSIPGKGTTVSVIIP